jgi:hypothetical protein
MKLRATMRFCKLTTPSSLRLQSPPITRCFIPPLHGLTAVAFASLVLLSFVAGYGVILTPHASHNAATGTSEDVLASDRQCAISRGHLRLRDATQRVSHASGSTLMAGSRSRASHPRRECTWAIRFASSPWTTPGKRHPRSSDTVQYTIIIRENSTQATPSRFRAEAMGNAMPVAQPSSRKMYLSNGTFLGFLTPFKMFFFTSCGLPS